MAMTRANEVIDISDDDENDVLPIQEHIWKQTLFKALNAIQAERELVALNNYQEFVNPGLKIRGRQLIPLPLTDHYAEVIKGLCGDVQGAHDAARNAWELDHTQFELINPAWLSYLNRIAEFITKGLRIKATLLMLQKMTLQGPNPSAKNTSGSGQSNRTIGYLTICLPSKHEGGNFHFSSGNRTTEVSTAASSALDLSVFGWYSDTECQVKELVSGYRLTITYELYKNEPVQPSNPSSGVGIKRVAEILRMWPWKYSDSNRVLYKLDKKHTTATLSLKDTKDRDRAVCQVLSIACDRAGLYMLFAEITCQLEDDMCSKDVTSCIDELYTLDGQHLTSNKELDVEEEVLGFDVEEMSEFEADSDEDEDASEQYLMEEHTTTRRWHDFAVLLIPKVGLLDLVRLGNFETPWRLSRIPQDPEVYYQGLVRVIAMALQDLTKTPPDPKASKVASNIISTLCVSLDARLRLITEPLVKWSLQSGDLSLYKLALQKAPMSAVSVLAEYLANTHGSSADTIEWKKWLDYIPDRPIGYFCGIYRDISPVFQVTSKAVSESFEAWARTLMNEKIDSERTWEFGHLNIILDWIRERSHDPEWITTRLLPKVASGHHSQSHGALLVHLLRGIYEQRHQPHFACAKEMYQAIIENSGGELNFPSDTIEPTEKVWSVDTPRHDLIFGPFARLLTECYIIGAMEGASQIIRETFSNLLLERSKWLLVRDPFGVIHCLIIPIIQLFAAGLSPTVPAVMEVLEILVRKIIRIDLPKQTPWVGHWIFRERGCGFCSDCAELNRFLTSPQLAWTFTAPTKRLLHIEHAIGIDNSLQVKTAAQPIPGTLIVTKTAPQGQISLQSWNFNHAGLMAVLRPLQGEFMMRALGEQRYREIILLEGVTPYAQPPPTTTVGFRRPATEDVPESAKRRRTSSQSPGAQVKLEPTVKHETLGD
ncbi:Ff.00g023800.m01.CDS01 [Fusarium sp. VM40]|nr:Ff.00g023800.m01.CDS01 [Fusarium sp. VM40]